MRLNRDLGRKVAFILLASAATWRGAARAAVAGATDEGVTTGPRTETLAPAEPAAAAEGRAPRDDGERSAHAEQRPFAFVLDPTTPAAGDTGVEYRLGYGSGAAADRPLPAASAPRGVEQAVTLGYGLTERLAPVLSLRVLRPIGGGASARATGSAGARFQLTDPQRDRLRVAVATVVFREFDGQLGVYARAAASYDMAGLRLAANLHLERVFAGGRDAVDVLAIAGASYQMLQPLRVGVEYVGQDLEGSIEDGEAEGGARHYVGPDVALALDHDRLQVVLGGAVGVGRKAQPVVGRLTALVTF